MIDSLRQAHPELILLDGGDFGEASVGINTWKTAELFHAMRSMKYDAIALGERDLAPGFFEEAAKGDGKKLLLSGNWRPAVAIGAAPARLIKRKSLAVGVTEVVSPLLQQGQAAANKETEALLQERLAELKKQDADVLVVIYHGAASEALALRQSMPEVDLWLLSHGVHQPLGLLATTGDALVVGPGDRGRELGFIAMRKEKGSRSGVFTQIILDQRIPDSPKVAPLRERFRPPSPPQQ